MNFQLAQLPELVKMMKDSQKKVLIHSELIKGLSSDESGAIYLIQTLGVDGIISSKPKVIEVCKKRKVIGIFRFFLKDTVSLPRDSIINSTLLIFKEELPYKFRRAKEARKGQVLFGYEGKPSGLTIETLSEVPEGFKTISFTEKGKDTVNLWHSPIEKDSIIFKVTNNTIIDTVTVKLRKKELDSLLVTQLSRGVLEYTDTMFFSINNPIIKVDTTKIDFKVSDSIKVPFTPFISQKENKIGFLFSKKLNSNYKLNLYPNALTDIFNISHDTIKAFFRTRKLEDYGDITLAIENPSSNQVII